MPRRIPAVEATHDAKWAKAFFEVHVTSPTTSPIIGEAYMLIAQHIVRLEQYIKLVDGGIEAAKRDLPDLLYSPRRSVK